MLVREWPPGRPRILVSDAWLANAGDGAIALATQARLARLAPGAAILHAAYQGDLLAGHYPELALVPPLAGLLGVTPAVPELAGWEPAAAEQIIAGAELVLCQGGGYLMEHYDPWERLRAWELVVERGIPISFGAQTVGPFRRDRERAALATVFARAAVITLRESESIRNVLELGARAEQLLVTADEAFGHFPDASADTPARRGIACVVSRDPQLRADGVLAEPDRSAGALAGLVAELVRVSGGEGVTLLSTFQGLGGLGRGFEDDRDVAVEAVAALPAAAAAQVRLPEGYFPPRRCAEAIAAHRALVTTRMHPAIFGVALGVPTVLVSHAYKATAMFATLGLGDIVVGEASAVAARLARPATPDAALARERCALNDAVVRRLLAATR
jgi:polysaccharide pyruvyl transferase WcaK-like protein